MPPAPRNQRRHPPHVYRNRRIVALVLVALVLWGVIAGVMALANLVGSMFAPNTSPTVAAGQACAAGDVTVEAMVGNADATPNESFGMNEKPYIWFKLTNIGPVSCTFDAGPAVQFFTIKSGNDQIWTSRECDRMGLQHQTVTLLPNKPVENPVSSWLRVRSSSTGCGADQTPVDAGAYNLTVEVNGVLSQPNQFLLG